MDAFGKASVIMPVIFALYDIAVHAVEDVAVFTVCQYASLLILAHCSRLNYYLPADIQL